MEGDDRSFLEQVLDEPDRRRLAHVGGVLLVGHSEQADPGAVERLVTRVQQLADLTRDVGGHGGVDAAAELDELGVDAPLAGLPGQVERVDRHAVTAQAGTRIEGHEAIGLGRAGGDDLPDVYPERVTDDLELVDQRDVDAAEDVLEKLRDLGRLEAGDGHQRLDEAGVKQHDQFQAGLGQAADDLRGVVQVPALVAGVDPLRRVADEEVLAGGEPPLDEGGHQHLLGRTGVGGALEDDQAARLHRRRQGGGRGAHVAQVGHPELIDRRGHGDDRHVGRGGVSAVGGRPQPARGDGARDLVGGHVLDV